MLSLSFIKSVPGNHAWQSSVSVFTEGINKWMNEWYAVGTEGKSTISPKVGSTEKSSYRGHLAQDLKNEQEFPSENRKKKFLLSCFLVLFDNLLVI